MTAAVPLRPVQRFGDGALVAAVDSVGDAHALAAAVAGWGSRSGVEDVVVGYRSVTVVVDPTAVDLDGLAEEFARIPVAAHRSVSAKHLEIPVCFDGPDLDEVAALVGLSRAAIVDALVGTDLTVALVGFLPGFAYLDGLRAPLAAVPRRSSPRTAVAAGSVAIGGGFAGIYPQNSPGGWQLIGRTAFALFDPDTPPFTALGPGDLVRLVPAPDDGVPAAPVARSRSLLVSGAARTVVVEAPGMLTMVQDLGRIGVAGLGVPRAGAADPYALRAANRLVGNDEGAGAFEITALGPRLRFDAARARGRGGIGRAARRRSSRRALHRVSGRGGPGRVGGEDHRRTAVLPRRGRRSRRRPRPREPFL